MRLEKEGKAYGRERRSLQCGRKKGKGRGRRVRRSLVFGCWQLKGKGTEMFITKFNEQN